MRASQTKPGSAIEAVLASRDIPIAIVSVEDDDGASRALGADAYFAKPLDRERLSAWLGGRPVRPAAPSAA